jgi:hypothetical protein
MLKAISKLVIVSVLFAVNFPVIADDVESIYQIDVILFEHTDSKRFDAEIWPKEVNRVNASGAINLSKMKNQDDSLDTLQTLNALDELGSEPVQKVINSTVKLVDANNLKLTEEANIIRNNKGLHLLQYLGWTQPLAANVRSTPVLIHGGTKGNNVTAVVSIKPVKNAFNVDVDMLYVTDQSTSQGVNEFKIKKDFKVKRREVFYLDHPLVGMMIKITPLIIADQ